MGFCPIIFHFGCHKFHYAVQKNPTELNIAIILIERAGMQAAYGKTYVLLNI